MAVTDEEMSEVRSRVHALEVEHRGQMQLTTYVLGRLGTIDQALVDHTKYLVEAKQRQDRMEQRQDGMELRQDRMEQRQDRMEQQLAQIIVKLDALPATLAALIKPAND